MSTALFFDTETTGFVQFAKPSVSPEQPHLVQLGAQLVDLEDRTVLGTLDLIVTPNGEYEVPEGASKVHGISTAKAERYGVFLEHAILPFRDMLAGADLVVAHNTKFDKIVMERASAVVDLHFGQDVGPLWLPKNTMLCTMIKSTPVVKKKSKRPSHNEDYAWPKLFEALKFFTGEDLEGAHNALVDVIACRKVFFGLLDGGHLDDVVAQVVAKQQALAA